MAGSRSLICRRRRGPRFAATLLREQTRPTLVVTARSDRAEAFAGALREYLPPAREPVVWPAPEALPYEQLQFDLAVATQRVSLLDRLLNYRERDEPAPVLVTSVHGLLQLVMGPAELRSHTRLIRVGDRLNLPELLEWAVRVGYDLVPLVQEPGTIARRGGIIDIFPPGAEHPVRIDLFGDEVDGIRRFAVSTQRTTDRLRGVTLLPPTELPLWRLQDARPSCAARHQRLATRGGRGVAPLAGADDGRLHPGFGRSLRPVHPARAAHTGRLFRHR